MCELLLVRADAPFAMGDLWPLAERMERDGLAGYGWGAAWLDEAGGLTAHRAIAAFRDDPMRHDLAPLRTTALLVHLRRPSRLSTLDLPDTQPFMDPAGRFAFGHNGDFTAYRTARDGYREQGRIHGRADSEVGARWLEDHFPGGTARRREDSASGAGDALAELHRAFGGQANMVVLEADGAATVYAGNTENPVFTFRLGDLWVAATGLYSLDRSFFRLAAPDATERHILRVGRFAVVLPRVAVGA